MDVIISLSFALFNTDPANIPSNQAIGVEITAAIRIAGSPVMPQSWIKMIAICPAMAPKVIPKLIPSPAIIGSSSDNTRNAFLANLVSTCPTKNSAVNPL